MSPEAAGFSRKAVMRVEHIFCAIQPGCGIEIARKVLDPVLAGMKECQRAPQNQVHS
jgi:hypothetical protein